MQKQLSTATPDVASLLATGYHLETPLDPPPPPPIDPPDNQGGGNLSDSDTEEDAPSQ